MSHRALHVLATRGAMILTINIPHSRDNYWLKHNLWSCEWCFLSLEVSLVLNIKALHMHTHASTAIQQRESGVPMFQLYMSYILASWK